MADKSAAYAATVARRMFAGRTGHGGGPCTSRVLNEAQIIALVKIAYEAGAAGKEHP